MSLRRYLTKDQIAERYHAHFGILVRYMIMAAEQKRFVCYEEISKLLGISHQDIRDFAGFLGNFCIENKMPPLNALIINTSGKPGVDWDTWVKPHKKNWEKSVAGCMKYFHLTRDQKVRYAHTKGMDALVEDFLRP